MEVAMTAKEVATVHCGKMKIKTRFIKPWSFLPMSGVRQA
jgi:hypothetical protein